MGLVYHGFPPTETKPQAAYILPTPDAWTLHGWYGSKMVAEMGVD